MHSSSDSLFVFLVVSDLSGGSASACSGIAVGFFGCAWAGAGWWLGGVFGFLMGGWIGFCLRGLLPWGLA